MSFNIVDFLDVIKKSKKGNKFRLDQKSYKKIKFTPPEIQTGQLDPETPYKFIKINSINIEKGIYGPFYRYTPYEDNLISDNYLGGYFTNDKISCCVGCVKIRLWLYDRERKYFYNNFKYLFRYECYFDIKDDKYATVYVGKVAFGHSIQIRPNNWIFGNDTERKNGIYFKCNIKRDKIDQLYCAQCKNKPFFETFENNTID